MTQKMADVRAVQGKGAMDKQATEDAVAAMKVAKRRVRALTEELSVLRTTHAQALLVCGAEFDALKVQLTSLQ